MKVKCNKLKYLVQDPVQHTSKCFLNKSTNSFNSLNYNLRGPRNPNSFNMAKSSVSVFVVPQITIPFKHGSHI